VLRTNWMLVTGGRSETRYPTVNEATTAGERYLLNHPSERRVALYEIYEDGHEGKTRMIFHWRDEYFHYLESGSKGKPIGKVYMRPCHRSDKGQEGE